MPTRNQLEAIALVPLLHGLVRLHQPNETAARSVAFVLKHLPSSQGWLGSAISTIEEYTNWENDWAAIQSHWMPLLAGSPSKSGWQGRNTIFSMIGNSTSNAKDSTSPAVRVDNFLKGIGSLDRKEALYELLAFLAVHGEDKSCGVDGYREISVYHWARLWHAVAVCLDGQGKDESPIADLLTNSNLSLVGADFSGIQSFIYNIVSKNAAKNLKGRSFYLQMLAEDVVQRTLDALGLSMAHIVYNSGGGFYVLAPGCEQVADALSNVRLQLEEELFEKHGTDLFIALDLADLVDKGTIKPLGEVWRNLSERLNARKRKRFAALIQMDPKSFFAPMGKGAEALTDAITGEEIGEDEQSKQLDDGSPVKVATHEYVELGKKLKTARYWAVPSANRTSPLNLFDEQPKLPHTIIYSLNPNGTYQPGVFPRKLSGLDYPFNNREPKTFDQLAEGSYLGILRMDVDYLGQLFQTGFSQEKRSLLRYAQLSGALEHFFQVQVDDLLQQQAFHDCVVSIYAGGDDLFMVGEWGALTRLAEEIQASFMGYVGSASGLSLSGGIAVVGRKFPIMQGAAMAGEAEELAKGHVVNGLEKNSITLFRYPLHWQLEFPLVKAWKDKLCNGIQEGWLDRGLLQRIFVYRDMQENKSGKQSPERWRWMMAYDLGRMAGRKNDDRAKALIEELKLAAFTEQVQGNKIHSTYTALTLMYIAARWAELLTK